MFAEAIQIAQTDVLKVNLYEIVANLVIVAQLMDYLPDADTCSQAAIALQPDAITLKGTRGSILVELCRVEEGVAMLEDVFPKQFRQNHFRILSGPGISSRAEQ